MAAMMTSTMTVAKPFTARKAFSGARVAAPVRAVQKSVRASVQTKAEVGVFFSTTTGNTEEVADMIADAVGASTQDIGDVADDLSALLNYDQLFIGTPTWNTGADESRSGTAWDDVLEGLAGLDFSGKKVAVFGCGDSSSYSDYFCDAIEELHTIFATAGADMVGSNSTDGYDFEESKSCVGGPASSEDAEAMLGLAIDVENQSDMTEDRVAAWTEQVKGEMGI